MNSQRPTWPSLVFVALVALLGGLVRHLFASQEFLWLDELHTSWTVNGSLSDVHERASIGNQTPFYFWVNWFSVQLLGHSETSLRLVSLIASIATIIASGWIVLRWTGSTPGAVLTAILIALNTQFIYYGSEARPFALVQLLGILQVFLFWRAFTSINDQAPHSKQPAWMLAIVSALLLYSHYTSVWIFVPELLFVSFWFIVNSKFRSQFWIRLPSTSLLTFLLCVPALLQLKSLFARRSNWESVSSIQGVIDDQVMPFGLWIAIPFIVLLIGPRKSGDSDQQSKSAYDFPNSKALFVFLWAIIPIVGVIALEYFDVAPIALTRYTLVGAAAFPIFAGLMLGRIEKRKPRIGMAAGLIAISLVYSPLSSGDIFDGDIRGSHSAGMRFEDWRAPVDEINLNQEKKTHPVFLASNLIEDVAAFENRDPKFQEYLLFPVNNLHTINQSDRDLIAIPTLLLDHFKPAHIRKMKEQGGSWVIVRGTQGLASEIESEVIQKSKELYPEAKLTTARYGSASSHVYLLSFDW